MIERITMQLPLCCVSCLLAALLCMSCGGDDTETVRPQLNGRWELAKSWRNKKQTQTLEGVYFQFGDDNRMRTNFPAGAEEFAAFELKQRQISQQFPTQVVYYQIKGINDSTLVLTTEMRGVLFELHLRKGE